MRHRNHVDHKQVQAVPLAPAGRFSDDRARELAEELRQLARLRAYTLI
ncbi:hypothetical protein [Streptomyces sp. NPDC102437]